MCNVLQMIHPKLTNAMRKAVSVFHGDAVVNRIYPNYTMNYIMYKVPFTKSLNMQAENTRVVFEYKDTLGQLEAQFRFTDVEQEIQVLQGAINQLLDLRNQCENEGQIAVIDERLRRHTRSLFVLEA